MGSSDEQLKECHTILEEMFDLEETGPFHEPVDWKEYGLFDYPQIVKQPMDMGTVQDKLDKNEYKNATEFAKDMILIWDNSLLYNAVRIISQEWILMIN